MAAAEEAGRYVAPTVYAHAPGRREISRSEAVRDGWPLFQLSDADYRQLTGEVLSAIVTVDRNAGHILGVRFLSGSPEPVPTNAFSPTLTRAGDDHGCRLGVHLSASVAPTASCGWVSAWPTMSST
jgi:hypothetical protein